MTLHELKNLVDIYYSDGKGGVTYDWDKANINVWSPDEQRQAEIYFTGSTRPGVKSKEDPGELNFNLRYLDGLGESCVMKAFKNVLGDIIDSKFCMSINWEKEFLKQLVKLRKE